jgi:arabinofuranosyltransferase
MEHVTLLMRLRATRPALWSRLFWIPVVVAAGWVYWRQRTFIANFRFDDSYITLRYAQQLAQHGILSFNRDEHIDGYTSLGWTLVLAAVEALGLDGAEWMLGISQLCGFASVLASLLLARVLGAGWALAIALSGIGCLYTPGFIVWSIPGMEMPFAALSYTLLVTVMVMPTVSPRYSPERAHVVRAAALFGATIARPEGALLAGMLWLLELILLTRDVRSGTAERPWSKHAAPYLVVAAALLCLVAWRWWFYGYPLPNTFYAKSSTPGLIAKGTADAWEFLAARGFKLIPLAAAGMLLVGSSWRSRLTLGLFAVWYVLVLVVYARSGGDFPGFHRFYQPMVPVGYAVLAGFVGASVRLATRKLPHGPRIGLVVCTLLAIGCGWRLYRSDRSVVRRAYERDTGWVRGQTDAVEEWRRAGIALGELLASDAALRPSRVATRAAGAIPHFARADYVYDMLALNNPDVAHHNEAVRDVPAHQKEATVAQVLAWKPNIVVGHPNIWPGDGTGTPPDWFDVAAYTAAGFRWRCIPMKPVSFFCFWQR